MAAVWWVIDGNNVMGAAGDGWWNDPTGAAVRLTQHVAEWSRTHDDEVTLVFDGAPIERITTLAGGNLGIAFATRAGRDAADDRIVDLVDDGYAERPDLTVVTSDKGLIRRLPPGVATEGAGAFRTRLGLDGSATGRRSGRGGRGAHR
jgi:predicted RNA-binding protein with PIN domain